MADAGVNPARARSAARKFLVQALYQRQLGGQPWQELHRQYSADPSFLRADPEYFRAALAAVCDESARLDEELQRHSDITPSRLDPVEHAILYLGIWELLARPDIPYRVVINEAVELAKRFGATDGHRYVNAVLDKASRVHRAVERGEVA
ncbi:MAG TPA: transcription antitermination factor NusB [Steroidobacteraceae bacterium]|nr:transcription antitermination factor NusB [Steroidobacteraceae bacterium]